MKNSKKFHVGFGISKSQADYWLSAVSKAKLGFPILFEVPTVLEILRWLPIKSPELVSVFIEASKKYFS